MTCDTQSDSGRCWRYGLGSQHYKSTLILLSLPQPSLLEIHGYYTTWKGKMRGGRSERMSHWKGKDWLKKVSSRSAPYLHHTHHLCYHHSFFLNTEIQLPHARKMEIAPCRPSPQAFPWYMFKQRTGVLDQSSFSRSAPGMCEAKFLWDPELPLFPLVGGKNRLSFKFRFSYITAHSRQK